MTTDIVVKSPLMIFVGHLIRKDDWETISGNISMLEWEKGRLYMKRHLRSREAGILWDSFVTNFRDSRQVVVLTPQKRELEVIRHV